MAAILTANMTKRARVTIVNYSVYEELDGTNQLVDQKPLVLKGLRDKSFAKKQLTKLLGEDADFIVTNVDAGEHLYGMSVADFIRNATVVDGLSKATGELEDPGAVELARFGIVEQEEPDSGEDGSTGDSDGDGVEPDSPDEPAGDGDGEDQEEDSPF